MLTMPRLSSLLVSVLTAFTVPAFPSVVRADHAWNGYHWARTSTPFALKLGDNVTSAWDWTLSTTSSDWTASAVLNTTVVPGGTTAKRCRPSNGRVEVCNAAYGNNGWLGVAQIWVSGSHITQGIVKLNDTYFNTATYNTPAWRNLVSCQEVGHTLGLDHQDENFTNANLGSCMDYTNSPSTNQHPNAHDYEELERIYLHLDNATTVGQTIGHQPAVGEMPPAMRDLELSGPPQWGKLLKGSPEEGASVYEADFGGGHKVFTFVTWTLEGRGKRRP